MYARISAGAAKVLRWILAFEAAAALFVLQAALVAVITDWRPGGNARYEELVGAAALFATIVLGLAWRRFTRPWVASATTLNLLWMASACWQGKVPFLPAFPALLGLVALSKQSQMELPSRDGAPNIPGDGTHRLLDFVSSGFQWVGVGAALLYWWQWAFAQALPRQEPIVSLFLLLPSAWIATAFHEFGHALAGWGGGMKIKSFRVGPFDWRHHGKLRFHFKQILSGGGGTGLAYTVPGYSRGRGLIVKAAGPLASLFLGVNALGAARMAKGRPWQEFWEPLCYVGTFAAVGFAVNLLPLRTQSGYSDGARIYHLLRGGAWADFYRAVASVGVTMVSPSRPRDFDIEAIKSAATVMTQGEEGLILRIYAHLYFFDRGLVVPEAMNWIREAEAVFDKSAGRGISLSWYANFVFAYAFCAKDSERARVWWQRMEVKQFSTQESDYWICLSALRWSEGRILEACAAWEQGNLLAEKLPMAGAYEFDRDCYRQLRQALDAANGGELAIL